MVERERDRFLSLSSALTGVAISSASMTADPKTNLRIRAKAGDLSPRNSPIDLATAYLEVLKTHGYATTLEEILARVPVLADVPPSPAPTEIIDEILADRRLGALCRSIIKLWYLGVWYDPVNPRADVQVVSSQAYKEALVWKVMRAHPMGYSMWTFGHWAEDPPELTEFLSTI